MRRILVSVALFGFLGPLVAEAESARLEAPELRDRIDAWARPFSEAGELSGTLLVARGDRVVYERSFGMANYELDVPNTPTTLFSVASVSKPLTAILALEMIEEGTLGVEDPLSRFIPGFPRGDEINVGHLLSHRSGIPHRVTDDAQETAPRTAEEMAAFAAHAELLFPPGTDDRYSSAGYSVLARVLEIAGKRPFGELLEERVLAPAGAVHSRLGDSRQLVRGRAESYIRTASGVINDRLHDLSFLVGAGSLYTTPRDLFGVLSRLRADGYGESARRNLEREGGRYSWNGWTDGFRAFADYHPEGELSVIFAGNLRTGAADRLRDAVPRIAAGEELPAPEVPDYSAAPVSPATRSALEGVYQLRPPAADSEEELRFTGDGGADLALGGWALVAIGDDRLFSPPDYATVRVVRAEDGSVKALAWQTDRGELEFPRVRGLGGGE